MTNRQSDEHIVPSIADSILYERSVTFHKDRS